jgi:hypothetical protein
VVVAVEQVRQEELQHHLVRLLVVVAQEQLRL